MPAKRRYIGPSGAIFVPNVPESTIAGKVATGEWTPVATPPTPAVEPEPARAPVRKTTARTK